MQGKDNCCLCPRNCGVDRSVKKGYCKVGSDIVIGATMIHKWEEPAIADDRGSGAIFFGGCPLHCVYCQNFKLSSGKGKTVSLSELVDCIYRLQDAGACNIDLVTPTQYTPTIAKALEIAKPVVPVVYNCGGYEKVETLRLLEGLVDIYLPDFKYSDADFAERYSRAKDYPEIATKAIEEMKRQVGKPQWGSDNLMKKGLLVRHLVLPCGVMNSKGVMDILSGILDVKEDYISIMSQYIPYGRAEEFAEINRKIKPVEYKAVVSYAQKLGFENIFIQESESADSCYIPEFWES